jgi:triacylglycerol lipase
MAVWLRGRPPGGRALVAGLALIVVIAGIVTAAAIRAAPTPRPATSRSVPGAPGRVARTGYPAQDRPGPVLLVPGYGGKAGDLSVLAGQIRDTGREAIVMHLPGDGTGDLTADARVLNAAVDRALRRGAPSVDVIGYSAGGVVALIWARDYDGVRKARRVITLGAPFHGTMIAAVAQAFVPQLCPVACAQLVPGSGLLGRLTAAPPSGLPAWLSLWTTGDLVVTPPDSARLAGAVDEPLQSVCPRRRISHEQLPTDPAVVAIVMQAISRRPLRDPTAANCRG